MTWAASFAAEGVSARDIGERISEKEMLQFVHLGEGISEEEMGPPESSYRVLDGNFALAMALRVSIDDAYAFAAELNADRGRGHGRCLKAKHLRNVLTEQFLSVRDLDAVLVQSRRIWCGCHLLNSFVRNPTYRYFDQVSRARAREAKKLQQVRRAEWAQMWDDPTLFSGSVGDVCRDWQLPSKDGAGYKEIVRG